MTWLLAYFVDKCIWSNFSICQIYGIGGAYLLLARILHSMVNISVYWFWMDTVMWDLYVDCSRSAVGHIQVAGIFVQEHMSVMWNVCISVLPVTLLFALSYYDTHTHTYIYIYIYICLMYTWIWMWHIYGIEGHICCWHIYDKQKQFMVVFLLICVAMWVLQVDNSISAVEHTYEMWQTYLFRGICQ